MKPMRIKSRQMTLAETNEIIEKGEFGVLSMLTEDNNVYGVPLNYTFFNKSIYFHSATEGYKLDNLRKNNRVSFCIVGESRILPIEFTTVYKSVIISGTTEEVTGQEKKDALFNIVRKYSPVNVDEGMKVIERLVDKTVVNKIWIIEMTGKHKRN